ncbi:MULTISPECIES: DUF2752 domain-containing protein [Clostridiaceae]|uniref:DUF2752 domain-containing protein n=1 Tax=Clostridium facile TaxID=2763035 RepID=A0ABR7ITF4_9CLOT|nr:MULTISPECIES: DUF2752 domain-containing protein [Clostridiaceae]MBC5788410.1 DUF2752 domain-containing protein [Clostridium facile]
MDRYKIKPMVGFICIGFLYLVWIQLTGTAIPCFFHTVTGLFCPGCGITRLILHLSQGDLVGAYQANQFLFITGPLLIVELILYFVQCCNNKTLPKWNQILLLLYSIALIVFGILRNVLSP